MIRAWPAVVGRAQTSTRVLGEIVLVVLLVVTAAATWRDGQPTDGFVELVRPPEDVAALGISGSHLSAKPPGGPSLSSAPAPPPEPPIPKSPPAQLLIPLLDVHRAVEKVGVDQSGVMNLPINSWNAGWYKGSPVPGAPGDSVIEGHAGYPGKPMIFGKLDTLHRGDRIIVVLANGSHRLFLVQSMRTVPAGSAVPGLADPYGLPRLTLITCTGHFDKKNHWFSDRLVLEARYAGLA
jgi:LPXTG-site transpeptidase (sortase) family protein